MCELFVTCLLLAGTRLAMHTYYKHSAMTNSIQKTPFCKSTVSKKSTGIVHKAKLHCTRPYHTRPYYTDFKAMPWRFRCEIHKLLASLNKSDGCSLVQEGWLTWVQGKKQQSIKTKPTWMQAHFSLFKTDTLQSHLHSLDAMIALHVALQGVLKHSSCRFDTCFVSVSWFAHIVLAQCVNFLLLVCFLQEQDWLCTHTTSIVLWQTAYRRHLFVRALSLKRAQASYTRPNYIALGHTTLGHTTLISKQCHGAFDVKPTSCWHHETKAMDAALYKRDDWLESKAKSNSQSRQSQHECKHISAFLKPIHCKVIYTV